MAFRHMLFTYSCLYNKCPSLDGPLDDEDLSEEMLYFVRDLCRTTDMLREIEVKEAKREGKKVPVARQQKVTGQKVKGDEESDEETDDSMEEAYDLAKDSDTGESSSKDSGSAAKHPSTSKWLPRAKRVSPLPLPQHRNHHQPPRLPHHLHCNNSLENGLTIKRNSAQYPSVLSSVMTYGSTSILIGNSYCLTHKLYGR